MTYSVRPAGERDLDALARFEADIARISFAEDAVVDEEVHRRKLERAMTKDPRGMFVAEAPDGTTVGWLWISLNTNFLTGDPYANFRSLAIDDAHHGTGVAELLLEAGIAFACDADVNEITGRVHVGNGGMRALYRKFGFEAVHLVMRKRCEPAEEVG
ncbi:MAG TPA: GNAT family N-acetyltransferase [Actinomycetota bacterium]|nr:GNAT family N-acetyltransferase [Actinomycetota bacterium]